MALSPGTRLGVYEITGTLGVGGMGEVYRARDTRLKREVALKVLPESFAADPDRLARFAREAEMLAALNHPNIAAIYGVEDGPPDSGPHAALVMELVDGETLADRIGRGAMPLSEALPIARQIVEALEAAHEQGIIHRDLKPANIKVREDGAVKVLDFGLAKLHDPNANASHSPSAPNGFSLSPTITSPALMTNAGMLLGTAAYMSPEQARGKPADSRSDIWAFGCVLYEMLTGRRAFDGEEVADVLASVLTREPDPARLGHVPPRFVELLSRCLDKSRKNRWQAIGDVRVELDVAARAPARTASLESVRPMWRRALPFAVTALVAAAASGGLTWLARPRPSAPVAARFPIVVPEGQRLGTSMQLIAVSPDGRHVVYATTNALYRRAIDAFDVTVIAGTENQSATAPVFAPDGASLVFFTTRERALKRIPFGGGVATVVARGGISGVTWGPGGLLFVSEDGSVARLAPGEQEPQVLLTARPGERFYAPQLLPDGDSVLLTVMTGEDLDRWDTADIVVHSLRTGTREKLASGSDARYLPSGHLAYSVSGVVFAAPFDPRARKITGETATILAGVRRGGGGASGTLLNSGNVWPATQYAVSNDGTMVFVPGPVATETLLQQDLVVADKTGNERRLGLPPARYSTPRASPDGRTIAYTVDDGREAHVWTYRLAGTETPQRLTSEGRNRFPVWSGDGQWLAFQSDHAGAPTIFRQRADRTGAAEPLTSPQSGETHAPESWSSDGKWLLFSVTKGRAENIVIDRDATASLWVLSLEDKKAARFTSGDWTIWPNAVFSRNGRWVAYSGRTNQSPTTLYVEPFPATGAQQRHLVANGEHFPMWGPGDHELFFLSAALRRPAALAGTVQPGALVFFGSVSVTTTPEMTFGNPNAVLRQFNAIAPGIGRSRPFDILPDGSGFVGLRDTDQLAEARELRVVVDWFAELKRLAPTK